MKVLFLAFFALVTVTALAQPDKSKRPSPPAIVTQTVKGGATITIDYSQPSLKGRKIGTDIAPYGQVWRTGANEATVFEVSQDVKVEGKALLAGKYGLYSIPGEKEWVFIFNKVWKQWGTQYNEAEDALRVTVPRPSVSTDMEKMTFMIGEDGIVKLVWGELAVQFRVH